MSDDLVNIEVNGTALQARKGQMLIEVTDAHGVYVPRFCYHEKLSIAANCRMCLVEVEKAPKPMPACATPVTEGMKVFTRSARAIAAQKATMEFLLINHPLDCPICDQGGECELQDLAMGFGRDVSRYAERKRVVKDKNLGPLVSTDMTRCIHCTRCVRFTQEIAGYQELGTVGRGESTEIGTFIERSVDHELSANIIDLCPVGALNNKPYRYLARAWEMTQHPLVSPHDCVGTNIYAHVLRGRVMRVVPRSNDAINESWIADRDRFSCDGLYGPDRIGRPLVREAGIWREQDWEPALALVAERLGRIVKQHGARELGALAAPSSTLEELYLLARILRALGSNNLDYRLRRTDFRDEQHDPLQPTLGCSIVELEQAQTILVIGSNLRKDVPILAHRVRKSAMRDDARISCISPQSYDYRFPTLQLDARDGTSMAAHLAAILRAALERAAKDVPTRVAGAVAQAVVKKWHREIAAQLGEGDRRLILLGAIAMRDPAYSDLRAIAAVLAGITGATLGHIPEGGNAVGAELAGVLPHRAAGGARVTSAGLNVADMLAARLKAYVLFGGIEPAEDLAAPQALEALREAEFVVALSPFGAARDHAHVILPIATHFETSGTYVNAEGRWQSVPGAAQPVGETRPGWKVLRVLGNLLDLPGFDYVDSLQVRDELAEFLDTANVPTAAPGGHEVLSLPRGPAGREVPIYRVDALVRRAAALQHTRDGIEAREPLELTA